MFHIYKCFAIAEGLRQIWMEDMTAKNVSGEYGKMTSCQIVKRIRNLLLMCMGITLCGVPLNASQVPRHICYLYSVLDPSVEILWFKIISVMECAVFILYIWFSYVAFDIISYGIPSSVNNLIAILSRTTTREGVSLKDRPVRISGNRFRNVLESYEQIRDFVNNFNRTFALLLFFVKFMFVVLMCVMVYVPLSRKGILRPRAMGTFIGGFAVLFIRVSLFVTCMGRTFDGSLEFKESWMKAFRQLYLKGYNSVRGPPTELSILSHYPLIQFKCGNFYGFTSTTFLTFFSVTTTYIIVVFQL